MGTKARMHGGVCCCCHVTVCDFAVLCIALLISPSVRSDSAMCHITTSTAAVNPLD